jgi:hypothetical protein
MFVERKLQDYHIRYLTRDCNAISVTINSHLPANVIEKLNAENVGLVLEKAGIEVAAKIRL